MKKHFFILIMLFAFNVSAFSQRIAVLEFNAGAGISQADVDGISAIFNTYFSPKGYTLVERTQINRVIDEQNFQRGKITQDQMVRIGQILNVSKVVLGDINLVLKQYNVDVRVIDVESGTIAAKEGTTWNPGHSYRTMMKNLATRLANTIAISPMSSNGPASSSKLLARNSIETLYDYLKIYPKELGVFQSIPYNVIKQINNQAQYEYDTWRIPTEEELSLLQANGYLSAGKYMTEENPTGIVLLVTDKPTAKELAEAKRIEAERIAEEERQRAEEQRQLELEREQFKSGLGVNGVYKIGDYYNRNGKEGIVYSVSEDGMHGKLVSLVENYFPYNYYYGSEVYNRSVNGNSWDYCPSTNDYDGNGNTDVILKCFEERNFNPSFLTNIREMRRAGWFIPALNDVKLIKQKEDLINKALSILGEKNLCDAKELLSSTLYCYEGLSGLVSVYKYNMRGVTFNNIGESFAWRYVTSF